MFTEMAKGSLTRSNLSKALTMHWSRLCPEITALSSRTRKAKKRPNPKQRRLTMDDFGENGVVVCVNCLAWVLTVSIISGLRCMKDGRL